MALVRCASDGRQVEGEGEVRDLALVVHQVERWCHTERQGDDRKRKTKDAIERRIDPYFSLQSTYFIASQVSTLGSLANNGLRNVLHVCLFPSFGVSIQIVLDAASPVRPSPRQAMRA